MSPRITKSLKWEGTSANCLVQPWSKQGQLEQVHRAVASLTFNIFMDEDSATSLDTCSSVQPLITVKKKSYPMFRQNFLYFSLSLVLSLYTMEKNLSQSSLLPIPHQAFIHIDSIPLNLPFSRLDNPSPLSISPYKKCSKPLIIFWVLWWTCSSSPCLSCTGELRTGHHSSPVRSRGEGYHLPWPALPNAAQELLVFFAMRVHCLLMFSLVSTRTHRLFSAKLLSSL